MSYAPNNLADINLLAVRPFVIRDIDQVEPLFQCAHIHVIAIAG